MKAMTTQSPLEIGSMRYKSGLTLSLFDKQIDCRVKCSIVTAPPGQSTGRECNPHSPNTTTIHPFVSFKRTQISLRFGMLLGIYNFNWAVREFVDEILWPSWVKHNWFLFEQWLGAWWNISLLQGTSFSGGNLWSEKVLYSSRVTLSLVRHWSGKQRGNEPYDEVFDLIFFRRLVVHWCWLQYIHFSSLDVDSLLDSDYCYNNYPWQFFKTIQH